MLVILREATIGETGQMVWHFMSIIHAFITLNRVIKVAKEFVGEVSFAVSNKDDYGSEIEALGLDASADVVAGLYDSKGKYAMTEDFR